MYKSNIISKFGITDVIKNKAIKLGSGIKARYIKPNNNFRKLLKPLRPLYTGVAENKLRNISNSKGRVKRVLDPIGM